MFSRISHVSLSVGLVTLAVLTGCNRETPLAPTPPVEVVISQPVTELIKDRDTYTGYVEAKETQDVRAQVRGEILDVPFLDKDNEGKEIGAGQLLFVIDDAPFQADLKQAKGQLITWEEKRKAADEKVTIYKPLAEKGTISKDEWFQALGAQGEAIGQVEVARGKISDAETNIKYCKIYSKIAGKIGKANFTKGNIVNASASDNLLTTIVSVDPVYVYFSVPERPMLNYQALLKKQYDKEKKQGKPDIPVEMALATDTNFPYKGIIDFVDNQVDKDTGNYKVRARFANPKGEDGVRILVPGQFARIRVAVGADIKALMVADRAILSDQSLKYVLTVNKEKNNTVERVDVVVSNRVQENGLRVVESGLTGAEWVIVEGVNRARPGATVAPREAPMPRRPLPK